MKDYNNRKTKWRRIRSDDGWENVEGVYYKVYCPYCNNQAYYNTDYSYYVLFDYCPFCGKKMKE